MNFYCATLIVFLLSFRASKQADFEPICNLPTRRLQGVTALGEKVLLIIDDHLYRFPFTRDYVHTERAMMALFSQPLPRDLPSTPVHWTSLRDIQAVVKDLGGRSKALRKANLKAMTFSQTASGAVQFAHVSLLKPQMRQYVVNVTSGQTIQMSLGSRPPVEHLSSGNDSRLGLTVYQNDSGQVFFTSGPVVVNGQPTMHTAKSLSKSSSSFAAVVKDSLVIFQAQYHQGDRPLIDDSTAVTGFIFNEVVHLWDFTAKTVYLFKVPSSGDLSLLSQGTELRQEPMSSYFICSRESWLQKLNAEIPPPIGDFTEKEVIDTVPPDDEDEIEYLSWIIIAVLSAILVLMMIILIVVGIYHYFSNGNLPQGVHDIRKRRKRQKTPKDSPKRSPQKSPLRVRKGVHQKKVSFSPQTSSVTSSNADSSVFVQRMLADRAPSSLTSLKSTPFDQEDSTNGGGGPPKTLFKAKLPDFGKVEKTVSKSMSKDHHPQSAVVITPPKQTAETKPLLARKSITDRNSFVESKRK